MLYIAWGIFVFQPLSPWGRNIFQPFNQRLRDKHPPQLRQKLLGRPAHGASGLGLGDGFRQREKSSKVPKKKQTTEEFPHKKREETRTTEKKNKKPPVGFVEGFNVS